jgi:sugar lactone lactonase YvrE
MSIRIARPAAVASLVALCVVSAHAAGARFWQVSTQADFLAGEVENLSIDMHGRLLLGPQVTRVGDSTTPFLWRILSGQDGSIYAGSGNDGQVFRFAPDGSRTVFFDAPELEVHALALAPGGGLFVGTSPEGKIYRVDAKGNSSVYFDPEDKYIWSLAVDSAGVLYAATGEKGLIYRITAEGKGDVFYRTKATHALTLVMDRNGDLLAGTEAPGKVFRIKKDGSGFLLLDSGLQEISALRVDDAGVIYAAAFSGKPSEPRGGGSLDQPAPEAPKPQPVPSVSTEITSIAIVDVGAGAMGGPTQPSTREPRKGPKGALFRIMPDGAWDSIWTLADDAPYDVLPENGGTLLVATGNKGKIYRVAGEPARATLVARADAQQVTNILRDAKGTLWFATSNPGKLFRLATSQATSGTYESDVRDAETVATWGAISWRGSAPSGTSVKLFTRSGNTSVPDDTWSPWSAAYTRAEGEQVTSPKARFLQWKTEISGSASTSAIVTSVTVAYLQRNLRPEVSSITIHPPGVAFQKPFSSGEAELAGFEGTLNDRRAVQPAQGTASSTTTATGSPMLGRRTYQKGLQTIVWKADDDNDDDLVYDVMYRREGEIQWKPLKRGLTDPIFVWDTTSVPNGTYVVKIVASDAPSNPPGTALTGERESRSFDIDNSPPVITIDSVRREGTRTIVEFTVKDDNSPVQRVEYSLDADRWRTIHPKDGIADSRVEQFELSIDGDATDKAVILRAVDSMSNVATTRAEAPAPSAKAR